jgi:hypothetical protein
MAKIGLQCIKYHIKINAGFIPYFCWITVPIGVAIPQKYLIIPLLPGVIPQICDKVSFVGMLSGKVQYNI